ncbi:MAG: site-specific DNA-methyltransferase [Candidatus Thorarchaeota archaeon]
MSRKLHCHTVERISPVSLFSKLHQGYHKPPSDFNYDPDLPPNHKEIVCSYDHGSGWANRIIYGDSLHVMESLVYHEPLSEEVQMVYFDPPFGINFDARYNPFETDLPRNSKVAAYRDNWTEGLTSYRQYLKERLIAAKKLLHSQGSIFVQISDANLHHVRLLLDEVFGAQNFCSMITFRTGTSLQSRLIAAVSDYLLWYAKNKDQCYSVPLFRERFWNEKIKTFDWIKLSNGHIRRLSAKEQDGSAPLPSGLLFKATQIARKLRPGETPHSVRFQGQDFSPPPGLYYPQYVDELVQQNRVIAVGSRLYGVRYESDFPFIRHTNLWNDTVRSTFAAGKLYPVQTNPKVIERCLLMTTKPGDLVLDPTGGSGTTAYVAEKWGRRWIVCDISRISKLVTRQRLLTASFDMYAVKEKKLGVKSGFQYKQRQNKQGREVGGLVPHITRGTLTKKRPMKAEQLVDRPVRIPGIVRVPGPIAVQTLMQHQSDDNDSFGSTLDPDAKSRFLELMTSALQAVSSVQMGIHTIPFHDIEPLEDENTFHATGKQDNDSKSVAFSFGAKHEPLESADIHRIAQSLSSDEFKRVFLIGFGFKAEILDLLRKRLGSQEVPIIPVCSSLDLHMGSLLDHQKANHLFEILPIPKIRLEENGYSQEKDRRAFQVEILDLFFIDPRFDNFLPLPKKDLVAWFLDSDYDGSVFKVRQAFFLQNNIWSQMKKCLKGKLPMDAWKSLSARKSLPFPAGKTKKIVVKAVDCRGNETELTRDLPA